MLRDKIAGILFVSLGMLNLRIRRQTAKYVVEFFRTGQFELFLTFCVFCPWLSIEFLQNFAHHRIKLWKHTTMYDNERVRWMSDINLLIMFHVLQQVKVEGWYKWCS